MARLCGLLSVKIGSVYADFRMDIIQNKTSRETQVKADGPGRRRPKEDENYWLEGEGTGQTGME